MIGRIVVGVHGSPGSLRALRFAVDHAHTFGTVLVPVIAWEPPGGDSALRHYPPVLADEWAEQAEKRLVAILEDILGEAAEQGVLLDFPARPHIVRGRPGPVLVAAADQGSDVLVIGSGQRGLLRRTMYGSVPHHCLARARCEVIVVPAGSAAVHAGWARSGAA